MNTRVRKSLFAAAMVFAVGGFVLGGLPIGDGGNVAYAKKRKRDRDDSDRRGDSDSKEDSDSGSDSDSEVGCDGELEFSKTGIWFEYNSSDIDLGIQAFFDSTGWTEVEITGPAGFSYELEAGGSLRDYGVTENFFESVEPALFPEDYEPTDEEIELAVEAALGNFAEGTYHFRGITLDGRCLEGSAELTHDLAEPLELDVESFPTVTWETPGPEVTRIEVVFELVIEVDDEEQVFVNTVNLGGTANQATASPEFVQMYMNSVADDTFVELKAEIVADEESGNRTITEEGIDEAPEDPEAEE